MFSKCHHVIVVDLIHMSESCPVLELAQYLPIRLRVCASCEVSTRCSSVRWNPRWSCAHSVEADRTLEAVSVVFRCRSLARADLTADSNVSP